MLSSHGERLARRQQIRRKVARDIAERQRLEFEPDSQRARHEGVAGEHALPGSSRPSSRPRPESFQPPNGAWSAVVSFTLTPRLPIATKPRPIERYDCEYRCNGAANLFVFLNVNHPCHKVKVTPRRAAEDFAACMRELADVIIRRRSVSGWCSTICRPIPSAPSTRHSGRRSPTRAVPKSWQGRPEMER